MMKLRKTSDVEHCALIGNLPRPDNDPPNDHVFYLANNIACNLYTTPYLCEKHIEEWE